MIDLSLSQIDSEASCEDLFCKYHKRKAIAFCIQPDCHIIDRFACSSCFTRPDIHFNHKSIDSKEIAQLLKGGLPKFKSQLTQSFDEQCISIIAQFSQNLKRFVYKKAEIISQRFECCFLDNLSQRDQKISELLLRLYEFQNTVNGNYIQEISKIRGDKLRLILQNEIEDIMRQLNDCEFQWELQRFDIESQVIHNLSKEALSVYQKFKDEKVFEYLEWENDFDSKLYLVNDFDFYTVSQFNKDGQRHGRTIEIPSHSHYFKGYLQNGQRSGKGLYIYEDGSVYVGMFKNNKKEGNGKLIKPDGYIYSGDWKKDEKNGQGIEKYNEEWIFEGFFENNYRSGPGQETNKKLGFVIQAIYEKGEAISLISQIQFQPEAPRENQMLEEMIKKN